MKTITNIIYPAFAAFALCCFAVLPIAQAVNPPSDGCYPNFTTTEGCDALQSLTTGAGNTGIGWRSLFSNTTGSANTGVGAGALILNTGDSNTAVGAVALLLNTTGTENTAVGTDAMVYNDTGHDNTATGYRALANNTIGNYNTANGIGALENTNADLNTGVGLHALANNAEGSGNTAIGGFDALYSNTTGTDNAAFGSEALFSNTANGGNTALGKHAGYSSTGSFNTFVGYEGGSSVTTANNVICIGANLAGADVDNTCFIGNIRGVTTQNADAIAVVIDSAGQLGTMSSSARFKKDVKPMDEASEAILALAPVTFHYKNDSKGTPQFGLIAEEVAKVNPDLVVHDRNGEIYTVRYEAVNAMLLNEFLKEHRKVEQQEKAIAEQRKDFQATISKFEAAILQQQKQSQSAVAAQQKQIQALTATLKEQALQIQKVAAQFEVSRPAPQTVSLPAVALPEGGNNQ